MVPVNNKRGHRGEPWQAGRRAAGWVERTVGRKTGVVGQNEDGVFFRVRIERMWPHGREGPFVRSANLSRSIQTLRAFIVPGVRDVSMAAHTRRGPLAHYEAGGVAAGLCQAGE